MCSNCKIQIALIHYNSILEQRQNLILILSMILIPGAKQYFVNFIKAKLKQLRAL